MMYGPLLSNRLVRMMWIHSPARSERRIILTSDRDFGELIYGQRLPAPAGVVYFRLKSAAADEPAVRLLALLDEAKFVLEGNFTVVKQNSVRQRPL